MLLVSAFLVGLNQCQKTGARGSDDGNVVSAMDLKPTDIDNCQGDSNCINDLFSQFQSKMKSLLNERDATIDGLESIKQKQMAMIMKLQEDDEDVTPANCQAEKEKEKAANADCQEERNQLNTLIDGLKSQQETQAADCANSLAEQEKKMAEQAEKEAKTANSVARLQIRQDKQLQLISNIQAQLNKREDRKMLREGKAKDLVNNIIAFLKESKEMRSNDCAKLVSAYSELDGHCLANGCNNM